MNGEGIEDQAFPEVPEAPPPPGASLSVSETAAADAPTAGVAETREPDSMARPPTQRYPDGRPSPRRPPEPERWAVHPDPPPPRPSLRRRLWWVVPFGGSLLAGVVFVLACVLVQRGGNPDFVGRACFVTTVVAVVAAVIAGTKGMSGMTSWVPVADATPHASYPLVAACIAVFAVAPTAAWVVLALR